MQMTKVKHIDVRSKIIKLVFKPIKDKTRHVQDKSNDAKLDIRRKDARFVSIEINFV